MRAALAVLLLLVGGTAHADAWDVRLPDEVTVAPGAPATVSLTISPGGGRSIAAGGTIRIQLDSATLTLPRHRYGRRQAADPAADAPRFELRLSAATAGDHELSVDVRAWVCRKKTCRPMHLAKTVIVHVVDESPPDALTP